MQGLVLVFFALAVLTGIVGFGTKSVVSGIAQGIFLISIVGAVGAIVAIGVRTSQ